VTVVRQADEGPSIVVDAYGRTLSTGERLAGTVIDQVALYGILTKLRDLSLALISVSVDASEIECKNDPDRSSARDIVQVPDTNTQLLYNSLPPSREGKYS
jgi:hypothetical protein